MTERDSLGSTVLVEGTVRIVEIDSAVEATRIFPRAYIACDPASLDSVFPARVIKSL